MFGKALVSLSGTSLGTPFVVVDPTDDLVTLVNSATDGTHFYLNPGVHSITNRLNINADITIDGSGDAVIDCVGLVDAQAIYINPGRKLNLLNIGIKAYSGQNILSLNNDNVIYADGVVFEGDVGAPTGTAINVLSSPDSGIRLIVSGCIFKGSLSNVWGGFGASSDSYAVFDECVIEDVPFSPWYGNHTTISNSFLKNAHVKISATATEDFRCLGNVLVGTFSSPPIFTAGIYQIIGNLIYPINTVRGIHATGIGIIANNTVISIDDGIFVSGTTVEVTGNYVRCSGASGRGIQIYNGQGVVTGNYIRCDGNSPEAAIEIGVGSPSTIVSSNLIDGRYLPALVLNKKGIECKAENCLIDGNYIINLDDTVGFPFGITSVSNNCVIENNVIYGAPRSSATMGIYSSGQNSKVIGNHVTMFAAGIGIEVLGDNSEASHNTVDMGTYSGIGIELFDEVTCDNNIIIGSAGTGIKTPNVETAQSICHNRIKMGTAIAFDINTSVTYTRVSDNTYQGTATLPTDGVNNCVVKDNINIP